MNWTVKRSSRRTSTISRWSGWSDIALGSPTRAKVRSSCEYATRNLETVIAARVESSWLDKMTGVYQVSIKVRHSPFQGICGFLDRQWLGNNPKAELFAFQGDASLAALEYAEQLVSDDYANVARATRFLEMTYSLATLE